jgi:hypothetical protein
MRLCNCGRKTNSLLFSFPGGQARGSCRSRGHYPFPLFHNYRKIIVQIAVHKAGGGVFRAGGGTVFRAGGGGVFRAEGAASPRTKEPRPHGRRSRVPTDEGGASPRTKEARPHGRRRRVPTDEGGASLRSRGERRTALGSVPQLRYCTVHREGSARKLRGLTA